MKLLNKILPLITLIICLCFELKSYQIFGVIIVSIVYYLFNHIITTHIDNLPAKISLFAFLFLMYLIDISLIVDGLLLTWESISIMKYFLVTASMKTISIVIVDFFYGKNKIKV